MVSTVGLLTLVIQPVAALLLLTNITVRNYLLVIYSIPALIFLIYTMYTKHIHTIVSKSGHLVWNWSNVTGLTYAIMVSWYLIFLLVPIIYTNYILFFIGIYVRLNVYYIFGSNTSSLWCFYVNIIMLYFLLLVLSQPTCK